MNPIRPTIQGSWFQFIGNWHYSLRTYQTQLTEDKIRVIESRLIEKGDPNQIVNLCWDIWKRNGYVNTVFWIDGSNRAMVNLLKIRYDERLTWESTQTFGPNTRIRPVNFSTEHRNMLSNLHAMISKGYLEIEEKNTINLLPV